MSKLIPPKPPIASVLAPKTNIALGLTAPPRQPARKRSLSLGGVYDPNNSPVKTELSKIRAQPSLLEQMPEEEWEGVDLSFRTIPEDEKEGIVNDDKENLVPIPAA